MLYKLTLSYLFIKYSLFDTIINYLKGGVKYE